MYTVMTDTDGYGCWNSTRFDLVLVFAMQMIDDEERTSGREYITRYILIEKWCSEDFHTENRSSVNEQKMVHITYRQCHCCWSLVQSPDKRALYERSYLLRSFK